MGAGRCDPHTLEVVPLELIRQGNVRDKSGTLRRACLRFTGTTSTTGRLREHGGCPAASPTYKRWRVGTLEGSHAGRVRGVVVLACGAVSGRGVDQQFGGLGALDNSRDLETEGYRCSSKGAPLGGYPCSRASMYRYGGTWRINSGGV